MNNQHTDKILTEETTVSCDGGAYEGHPRVFLDLEKNGEAKCPYCGCLYILAKS